MSCVNFIIQKVNGIDVSNLPHEEAVQLFLKAQEPIIVEVRRRTQDDGNKLSLFDEPTPPSSSSSPAPPALAAIQSSQGGHHHHHQSQQQQIAKNKNLLSTGCQTDITTSTVVAISSTTEQRSVDADAVAVSSPQHCYHSDGGANVFNECLAPEIDIEEITLRKSRSDEKLGFTVSYSSGNGSASECGSDVDDDDNDDDDDEDTCADIYISDILPDSVAARDGRLRQGDQILQINGRDVSNKDETESLFAESKNAVTLLVSRCLYTDDEFLDSAVYCDDKDNNLGQSSCECEQNTFSSKSSKSNSENNCNKLQSIVQIDASVCDHLSHANIKAQLESVNKEISLLNSQISNMKLQKSITTASTCQQQQQQKNTPATIVKNKKIENLLNQNYKREPPRIPFIPAPPIEPDIEHIYETIPEDSETDSYYCSPYESKERNRVEQWLKSQDCTTTGGGGGPVGTAATATTTTTTTTTTAALVHLANTCGAGSGGGGSTLRATSKDFYLNHIAWNRICKNNSSGEDYENSSSAYNTGGSCNSNPLTFELKSDDKNQSSSTLVFRPYSRQLESIENCKQCQRYRKEKLSPKNKKLSVKATEVVAATVTAITSSTTSSRSHQQAPAAAPSGIMYTNVENLRQTIKLQQKLFRKSLIRQNSAPQARAAANIAAAATTNSAASTTVATATAAMNSIITASSTSGSNNPTSYAGSSYVAPSLSQYQFVSSQQESTKSEQLVWKVKRRPDGTRYIVRRPIKSQLLQDRARRINEERNSQTTEDETVSEVKVGKYWTKDERKRHVEKSKERRQRQEILIEAKKNQTQQWLV